MKFIKQSVSFLIICSLFFSNNKVWSQWNLDQSPEQFSLQHGIRQFEDGNFVQAIHTLERFLSEQNLTTPLNKQAVQPDLDKELAQYYIVLSKILYGADDLEIVAENYIQNTVNTVHRDRASFYLAHHYFLQKNFPKVIEYYDIIDIKNLDNKEIANAKFEQAYAYFIESDFDKAYPYFAAIKELENNTYFFAGNYYYGLLAYHRGEYDAALTSFNRIVNLPEYKEFVPYYIAEIQYYKGDYDKVLELAQQYTQKGEKLYYDKEMKLLMGQVYFERKKYKEALPYLEYYYENTEKISKENLYELAFTHYQLQNFEKAIEHFKPLSVAQDSLGQNSMYLLGDAYIKTENKEGAMQAFSIASNTDFNPAIQETSQYLYAQLAYELGDELLAVQAFKSFIQQHPNSSNTTQAKTYLVSLLSKSKDYEQAYNILSEMDLNSTPLQTIYQKVTLGRALDLWNAGDITAASNMLDKSLKYKNDEAVYGAAQFWRSYLYYEQNNFSAASIAIKDFIQLAKTKGKEIKAISKEATLENAYTHLGYAQMKEEKYSEAQQSFLQAGNTEGAAAGQYKQSETSTLLQADAAFMAKKYDEAYLLYEKVIMDYPTNAAYAMYQKALIAGLKSETEEKKNLLQKVIKNYPSSEWSKPATYELAVTLMEAEKWKESETLFTQLSKDYDKQYQSKALLKLAYIAQKKMEYKTAIQYYEQFLTQFKNHPETKGTVEALNNCYLQSGNPEGFFTFLKNNDLEAYGKNVNMEDNYYFMAEEKYIDDQFSAAIPFFDQYLEKFPQGKKITEANFYKGESYLEIKNNTKAAEAFKIVLQKGNKDFSQLANLRLANIYFEQKDYDAAIQYAQQYLATASSNEALPAQLILMKAYHLQGDQEQAGTTALLLESKQDQLSTSDKVVYKLVKGNQEQSLGNYAAADAYYKEVVTAKSGSFSAEARYRLAENLLLQNKLTEAEKACDEAIKNNSADYYWKVKSYILIAEILAAQKDYFNARATLNSVIKNSNNEELKTEAAALLKKVDEEEQAESKIINK